MSLRDQYLLADTDAEKAALLDEHVGTNIARLSTDASGNTVLVGADGTTLLTIDASGNILANVNLRTGAIDTLLALAGGAGEIAVATDVEALVKFTGVAGQAKAFYRNTLLYEAVLGAACAGISTTSTVFTPLTLNDDDALMSVFGAPTIWTAGTPTEIVLPAITAGYYAVTAMGLWSFSANATGTVRRLRMEVWNGSAWVASSLAININTDAACSATDACANFVSLGSSGGTGLTRFRISAASSSAAALTVAVPGGVRISVRKID